MSAVAILAVVLFGLLVVGMLLKGISLIVYGRSEQWQTSKRLKAIC